MRADWIYELIQSDKLVTFLISEYEQVCTTEIINTLGEYDWHYRFCFHFSVSYNYTDILLKIKVIPLKKSSVWSIASQASWLTITLASVWHVMFNSQHVFVNGSFNRNINRTTTVHQCKMYRSFLDKWSETLNVQLSTVLLQMSE